jgi:hypothetical protein
VRAKLPIWSVDPPAKQRGSDLREQIADWITAQKFHDLAREFGATPPTGDIKQLLAWYADLSGDKWDYRRGRARNLAERPDLSDTEASAALNAAKALGLVTSEAPARDSYNYCLVLGGLVRVFRNELPSAATGSPGERVRRDGPGVELAT